MEASIDYINDSIKQLNGIIDELIESQKYIKKYNIVINKRNVNDNLIIGQSTNISDEKTSLGYSASENKNYIIITELSDNRINLSDVSKGSVEDDKEITMIKYSDFMNDIL